jgi:hypothetical protein
MPDVPPGDDIIKNVFFCVKEKEAKKARSLIHRKPFQTSLISLLPKRPYKLDPFSSIVTFVTDEEEKVS